MIQRISNIAGIAGWLALAFIAYATLSPIEARPVLAGPQLEHFAAFALMGLAFGLAYPNRLLLIVAFVAGAAIGLAQDMLGPYPIGIYGIAKTVVGFGASSLGAKLDVENAGARLLVTLGFYLLHQAVYFTVARGMVNLTLNWSWSHGILAGLANGVVGMVLYFLLDKFKQRT